ncbi:class I SAM-dependent methyltransferase [Pleionea litopenaei]|uniref:Ribosomal RNA small subunit methyltransferase J n=1 Tax=Pleionea litopenaei TaxID=3070815 RepID=A0AA51RR46_9GAMM|nr:class I SAM-dependent methyltransferase [Pleionea sp. HL-JVS1]WMS85979.1 class I SAM-dependent methyltransferase [Pleionea sp. HL-JVS1]
MLKIATQNKELSQAIADVGYFSECPERSDVLWWLDYSSDNKLSLSGKLTDSTFDIFFDFNDPSLMYRLKNGGGRKEPLAKAIGLKGNSCPSVIDATTGMGRESFLLAHLGCHVTSLERNPVIFSLLNNALSRYQKQSTLNWSLLNHDSIQYLSGLQNESRPDVVYLDPMFPERSKSAAVKKEMRVFKQLAGEDLDADMLLTAALNAATQRVVVKRPKSAPFLNQQSPSHQIVSKKHRFDVYLSH